MKGSQKAVTTRSGFCLFMYRPALSQLKGLMELTNRLIFIPSGAGSSLYCVLPGKRNEGYWSVKVTSSTSWPSA